MSSRTLARLVLGFIFIYQGLIPKLIALDKTELYLNQLHLAFMVVPVWLTSRLMAQLAGIGEILLGLAIVIFYRKNWPVWLAIIGLIVLLLDCALLASHLLMQAFNPMTTNVAALALAWIALKPKTDAWNIKLN